MLFPDKRLPHGKERYHPNITIEVHLNYVKMLNLLQINSAQHSSCLSLAFVLSLKGTSSGLEALPGNMNDSYHKNVLTIGIQ